MPKAKPYTGLKRRTKPKKPEWFLKTTVLGRQTSWKKVNKGTPGAIPMHRRQIVLKGGTKISATYLSEDTRSKK